MCLTLHHCCQRRVSDSASLSSVEKSQHSDERLDRVACSHQGSEGREKGGEREGNKKPAEPPRLENVKINLKLYSPIAERTHF